MGRFLWKFKRLSLPEKKYFYSSLKDGKRDRSNGNISDEQYLRLQNVVGKMKDEYGGKSTSKYVGLKSKMYSILDKSNNKKSTNKGHNTFIEFQKFQNTLLKKKILRHNEENKF